MNATEAHLAEDFQQDLVKLKHMVDAYSNYTQDVPPHKESTRKHGRDARKGLRNAGRPIKMSEIGEIASQGDSIVGCTCELFRWVQKGPRKEGLCLY